MTITIAEVIEQCAKVCANTEASLKNVHTHGDDDGRGQHSEYIKGGIDTANLLAYVIRALKQHFKYRPL